MGESLGWKRFRGAHMFAKPLNDFNKHCELVALFDINPLRAKDFTRLRGGEKLTFTQLGFSSLQLLALSLAGLLSQESAFGQSDWTSPVTWKPDERAVKSGLYIQPRPLAKQERVEFTVTEPSGADRKRWPVRGSIPLYRGELLDPKAIRLLNAAGQEIPVQGFITAYWPEKTARFLCLDFITDIAANQEQKFVLEYGTDVRPETTATLKVMRHDKIVEVNTAACSGLGSLTGDPAAVNAILNQAKLHEPPAYHYMYPEPFYLALAFLASETPNLKAWLESRLIGGVGIPRLTLFKKNGKIATGNYSSAQEWFSHNVVLHGKNGFSIFAPAAVEALHINHALELLEKSKSKP